jgi:hypothetical protein
MVAGVTLSGLGKAIDDLLATKTKQINNEKLKLSNRSQLTWLSGIDFIWA